MTQPAATALPLSSWISTRRPEPETEPVSALRPVPEAVIEDPVEIRTRPLRLGTVSHPWQPDPRTLRSLERAPGRPLEICSGIEIADWAEMLARLDRRHVVDVRIVSDAPERRVLAAVRELADRGLAVRVHRVPGHDSQARLSAFLAAARAAGAVDVEIAWPRFGFGRAEERRTGLRRLRLQLGLPRFAPARG